MHAQEVGGKTAVTLVSVMRHGTAVFQLEHAFLGFSLQTLFVGFETLFIGFEMLFIGFKTLLAGNGFCGLERKTLCLGLELDSSRTMTSKET